MYTEARPVHDSVGHLNQLYRGRRPSSVLLVESDLFQLSVLEDMLGDFGVHGITKAMGSLAGLIALDAMATPPDLVMCDLDMPGVEGQQFMESLGARGYKGAVVLMSGADLNAMHAATLTARYHHVKIAGALGKPISASALAAVLRNLS